MKKIEIEDKQIKNILKEIQYTEKALRYWNRKFFDAKEKMFNGLKEVHDLDVSKVTVNHKEMVIEIEE